MTQKYLKHYGMELIVDIHECDIIKFQRKSLDEFFSKLVKISNMQAVGKPHYWLETSNEPHLKGYSGIQFIKTSNILIHTLDITHSAYINFFSCKEFNVGEVLEFIRLHFSAGVLRHRVIERI